MKMMSSLLVTGLVTLSLTSAASAYEQKDDGAYLDPPYKNLKHPKVDDHAPKKRTKGFSDLFDVNLNTAPTPDLSKSDVESMIAHQTPIRNQAARGTCSIFSSTAMLESMMIIRGEATTAVDLSEEWLEYQVTRVTGSEGSSSVANFNSFLDEGDVEETLLPYIGETWTDATSGLAQTRCGTLSDSDLSTCLLGHWNPNLMDAPLSQLADSTDPLYSPTFLAARNRALTFQAALKVTDRDFEVSSTSDLKDLLRQGIPASLEISFYYGAWNHRGGDQFGITRNMDDWAKGIVFYPEVGSIDRDRSPEEPDGHSIVIVGYDDNIVLTKAVQMSDGTTQTFTRKGVYFFKNAWGTDNFGPLAMIEGVSHPGYGTISQDYANEFGSFYKLPLE
jgi:hypothetical protein